MKCLVSTVQFVSNCCDPHNNLKFAVKASAVMKRCDESSEWAVIFHAARSVAVADVLVTVTHDV